MFFFFYFVEWQALLAGGERQDWCAVFLVDVFCWAYEVYGIERLSLLQLLCSSRQHPHTPLPASALSTFGVLDGTG